MENRNGWLSILFFSLFCCSFLICGCGDQAQQEKINTELRREIADLKGKLLVVDAVQDQLEVQTKIEDVKQLHYRYVDLLTRCQWDEIVQLFSRDIVLDVSAEMEPMSGYEKVKGFYLNVIATSGRHVGKEANLSVHPRISVEGDTATGSWMLYIISEPEQESNGLQLKQITYDLGYTKEDGLWKISALKVRTRIALGAST